MSKTSKKKKGKLFRENANKPAVPKGRNWTEKETEAFCYVLADGEFDFDLTLETKALKKQANKEVFEGIQSQLKISLNDPEFYDEDFEDSELDISIPKLRNKYNNLKRAWRATVDRAKSGSGLHVEKEPNWFQILHPVLSDTNSNLDDVSSGPQDTSLLNQVRNFPNIDKITRSYG